MLYTQKYCFKIPSTAIKPIDLILKNKLLPDFCECKTKTFGVKNEIGNEIVQNIENQNRNYRIEKIAFVKIYKISQG